MGRDSSSRRPSRRWRVDELATVPPNGTRLAAGPHLLQHYAADGQRIFPRSARNTGRGALTARPRRCSAPGRGGRRVATSAKKLDPAHAGATTSRSRTRASSRSRSRLGSRRRRKEECDERLAVDEHGLHARRPREHRREPLAGTRELIEHQADARRGPCGQFGMSRASRCRKTSSPGKKSTRVPGSRVGGAGSAAVSRRSRRPVAQTQHHHGRQCSKSSVAKIGRSAPHGVARPAQRVGDLGSGAARKSTIASRCGLHVSGPQSLAVRCARGEEPDLHEEGMVARVRHDEQRAWQPPVLDALEGVELLLR